MLLLFFKSFINELIFSVEKKRCECLQVRVWVSTVSAPKEIMCSTSEIMSWGHELTSGRNHGRVLWDSHSPMSEEVTGANQLDAPALMCWWSHTDPVIPTPPCQALQFDRKDSTGWNVMDGLMIMIFGTVSGWDLSLTDQAELGSQFFHGNKVLKAG